MKSTMDEELDFEDNKHFQTRFTRSNQPNADKTIELNAEETAFLKSVEDDEDLDVEIDIDDYVEDEDDSDAGMDMAIDLNNRSEKSLGTLTKRFIKFLQESPVGLVDINSAADKLNVSQKRRIYDITNVLEGIGMIEKKSKNVILWKGGQLRKPGGEIDLKPGEEKNLHNIKADLTELEREERLVDTHLSWIKQSMRNVCEDQDNCRYAFITKDEGTNAFEHDQLLLLQAPPGTDIQIGEPSRFVDEVRYHLKVKSHSGPATLSFVNDQFEAPVFVQRMDSKPMKAEFSQMGEVPTNILENEDDDDLKEGGVLDEVFIDVEALRSLSPPPSDQDYAFSLSRGETLMELFSDDVF